MSFEKISVVGLGYIGLPTATMFAAYGKQVVGVDVNQEAVDIINQGKIHIVEPDLDTAVHAAVNAEKLKATTQPEPADAFIIAVPTPFKGDHEPDLSYIHAASKAIAPVLSKGNLVILESTSPVGATEQMAAWLAEERPDLAFPSVEGGATDIHIAHCPERVLPGHVMRELIENDRVIGGVTQACATKSVELYKTFVKGECITTNVRTAEMAKLTENSFRDVNIAFANELSMICDKLDINVWELIQLANRHPRVDVLQPGCGVGGHCIAVDPWFIVDSAPEQANLVRMARNTNDHKPEWVAQKILEAAKQQGTETVVCMGLSFKPDIDDLRESPAIEIVKKLSKQKIKVMAVEPNITALPVGLKELDIELIDMAELDNYPNALSALLVSHSRFKNWLTQNSQNNKLILDFCGITNKG